MSEAVAEEPTEFKTPTFTFDERVQVKEWDAQLKVFRKPFEKVWACRKETKKGLLFHVYGTTRPGADLAKSPGVFFVHPKAGSVITDASGTEYEVESTEGSNPTACWVRLTKAAPKKP